MLDVAFTNTRSLTYRPDLLLRQGRLQTQTLCCSVGGHLSMAHQHPEATERAFSCFARSSKSGMHYKTVRQGHFRGASIIRTFVLAQIQPCMPPKCVQSSKLRTHHISRNMAGVMTHINVIMERLNMVDAIQSRAVTC